MDNKNYNTMEEFQNLVNSGDILECPVCGSYSAYYEFVNMNSDTKSRFINSDGLNDSNEEYTNDEILTNWPDVYSIGACSCFEWQCGKCKTYLMPENSPINHPCYTHSKD